MSIRGRLTTAWDIIGPRHLNHMSSAKIDADRRTFWHLFAIAAGAVCLAAIAHLKPDWLLRAVDLIAALSLLLFGMAVASLFETR